MDYKKGQMDIEEQKKKGGGGCKEKSVHYPLVAKMSFFILD